MRPYFALIKDSFRAAIASNVLYVLLAIITVLLLAIAPLHVKEVLDWQLKFRNNVPDPDALVKRLVDRGQDPDSPAVNRVWDLLSDELRTDLKTLVQFEQDNDSLPKTKNPTTFPMQTMRSLENELNEIIKRNDFYQSEAWASKRFNAEAREMLDAGVDSLSAERSKRLNRLLMASAFPGVVQRGSGNALELWYGPWQWEDMTFSVSHNEFAQGTLATVTWFFDKFVLSIGLFIAILVTANFIPETFLPGSLNLLLSKPVSRWGLLLSKFAGGCAFVSLCAVYLFIGLWLWLGMGMGIWDQGILWGIPLYIVVFAIYYSVSTFVGVLSRSAILAIIVTGVFWAACFLVGLTHQVIESRINNARTRGLMAVNDELLQVGELSSISRWDDDHDNWEQELEIKMMEEQRIAMGAVMFAPGAGDDNDLSTLGPIYDPGHDLILAGLIDLGNPSSVNHKDLYASPVDEIKFREIGKAPRNTKAFLPDVDGVIAVLGNGEFKRFAGAELPDKNSENEEAENKPKSSESDEKTSGLASLTQSILNGKPKSKNRNLFEDIGPVDDKISVNNGNYVTLNPANRDIYVYRDAVISRFSLADGGKYQRLMDRKIETEVRTDMRAIIRAGGDTVVVALGNGAILSIDADTLEIRQSYLPQKKSPIINVVASSDGEYFVFHLRDRTVWLLDTTESQDISQLPVSGQGSITAVQFDDQDRLWFSTVANQAQLYDLEASRRVRSVAPEVGLLTRAFNWVIDPFYRIAPKPGEFYKIVSYLAGDSDQEQSDVDLNSLPAAKDPWQPLWSGLLFMCGMLAITCLVFQFRDF